MTQTTTPIAIVTGANAGIGAITAKEIARTGYRVYLACRSEAKARPVIDEIRSETGEEAHFLALDLASFESVKKAVDSFTEKESSLTLLVNNAGVAGHRGVTKDGFELQFGVNHMGHYLFTRLLLPFMEGVDEARVVTVASLAQRLVRGINYDKVRGMTRTYVGYKEYCVSKLANVLFSYHLAKVAPRNVKTYAVHPGVVASEIWRRIPWPFRPLIKRTMITVEEGAQTTLYCALSDQVSNESGLYYSGSKVATPNPCVGVESARELWDRSEAWAQNFL